MGHPGLCGGFWGGGGCFAEDFGGGLVFAEAEEGGLANEVVGGPGGEADLSYELWFDPVGASAGFSGWIFEGRGGSGEGF
jgi:hypothetical protein